jgi:transcriptional regulator with XRE-family HTH domain
MLNISQEELAFRCSLHPNYISDIERGRRNLSLISIAKLASGLDVGIDALFIE